MDEQCCPLCRKLGNNKKIRSIQVNYDETVLLCEEEQCPWPLGYEEFKFFPRQFTQLSKKSRAKADTNISIASTSISPELGVYTPPVTPSSEGSSKDSPKIDNSTSLNSINSTFTDKISPTYRSRAISTAQRAEENSQSSVNPQETSSQPIASIFDIDSSVPVGKIELMTMKQKTGTTAPNVKILKQKTRPTIIGKKLKTPQIRSIRMIPHNSIKIEVKEDLSTPLVTSTTPVSPSKGEIDVSRSKLRNLQSRKRASLANGETENVNNADSMEVPKKILKVSDEIDQVDSKIGNQSHKVVESPYLDNAGRIGGTSLTQSDVDLRVVNFDGRSNTLNNSGQMGLSFDGIFEEMLMDNCQNVTQEIDDDWLNSLLS